MGSSPDECTLYLARFPIARRRWRKRARWETPGRELLPGHLRVSATLYLARFFPMRALWDRSRARPVGDTARRSVGNRKERPGDATMRVPRRKRARWETPGRELLPGRLQPSATLYLARFPIARRRWQGCDASAKRDLRHLPQPSGMSARGLDWVVGCSRRLSLPPMTIPDRFPSMS